MSSLQTSCTLKPGRWALAVAVSLTVLFLAGIPGSALAGEPAQDDQTESAPSASLRPAIHGIADAGDRVVFSDSAGTRWCYRKEPWGLLWSKPSSGPVVAGGEGKGMGPEVWGMDGDVAIQALRSGVSGDVISRLTGGAHPTDVEIAASQKPEEVFKPTEPVIQQTSIPIWETQYQSSRRRAKTGLMWGGTGIGIIGGTIVAVLVAESSGRNSGNLFVPAMSGIWGGYLISSVGSVILAAGNQKAYNSLVAGGRARKGLCGGCKGAWISLASTPVTFFGPQVSVAISAAQFRMNQTLYQAGQQSLRPRPQIRLYPSISLRSQGVRLAGQF